MTGESGTIAAACGGTTTLIDFAIQDFGKTLHAGVDAWHKRAEDRAAIDYAFHIIVRELHESHLKEMDELVGDGITSFKLFMAYPGVFMVDDATIFKAMLRTKDNGGLICMHAENGGVIDTLVRARAERRPHRTQVACVDPPDGRRGRSDTPNDRSRRDGGWCPPTSFTCRRETRWRKCGERASEAFRCSPRPCPQYLFLSYEDYEKPGFEGAKYVMSPPLRPKGNEERLWNGLQTDALQAVSTDHCSFCMKEQKELGKNRFLEDPRMARPGSRTA